jgi:hypothetical protein
MSFITPIISFLTQSPARSIATIQGYITLQESTTDSLELTSHPVQQGASITDHAYRKPIQLSLSIQFAPATITGKISNAISPSLNGQVDSLVTSYQKLLALQNQLQPFAITTAKRTYGSMMMTSLSVTTDKKTENVLSVSASFQEVIIVNVTVVQVPKSALRTPNKNQSTMNAGKKSALLVGSQAIKGVLGG